MLRLENLCLSIGRAEILKGIDLSLERNEILGLVGPNGAGKTATLLALSGVYPATKGRILLDGEDITAASPAEIVYRGVAHVPQGRLVFPKMTIEENLMLGAFGRGGHEAGDLQEIYDLFPILAERRTHLASTLSGGQQQMLAIGRGLMARPKVLMLDEPQLGLAPAIIEQVADTIRDIHSRGCTIILVGQHAALALALSDKVAVIESGRIVVSGTAAEIAADDKIQRAYLGVS